MDWNKVITDLVRSGMKQGEIAKAIGVGEGTLSEMKTGLVREPKWSKGDRLLALHRERCRQAA